MQARSEKTRRRLMQAGAHMFNQNGYSSATLGQIAQAAGMTKGALYFHFASKDGLADAVQQQGHDALRAFVRRQHHARTPPVQALIDLTHWLARTLCEDPVVRAAFRISRDSTRRRPPAADFRQAWTDEALRLIDRARATGDLREHHTAAHGPGTLLSAALTGIGALCGDGAHCPRLRETIGALWHCLLPALVPQDHTARYDVHALTLPPPQTSTTTTATTV
ncbi:ScbR family autoregulator-binding transcription factor [Streptomyces sp. NPDC002328]|uniref:ScbR family autoregulator-binding transcription factor n=1 Tax=Streptomyces sp. NPDC002328 TaxID=3364642 RepID=UPI00367725BD